MSLLARPQGMTTELAAQNKALDALDAQAAATHNRVKDVNTNSQLRNLSEHAGRGGPQ